MVSKIIALLITLFVGSLEAHDNTNQITAHINPLELGGSYVTLDHQSHFYAPNGDVVLLHLAHTPHSRYFQNEIGVGYRRFFSEFGIGANLYYMNTTQPSLLIHQLSPGLELFYGNFQFSLNSYLPTAQKRTFRKGDLYHSTISELGVRYSINRSLSVGLLPNYDHTAQKWGLNSRIAYTHNDRFEFALSPYFKRQGSGCTFSFGVNFGAMKTKENQSTNRTNLFSYMVEKKQSKAAMPPPERIGHVEIPVVPPAAPPVVLPPVDEGSFCWWKFLPFYNSGAKEEGKEEVGKQRPNKPEDPSNSLNDFLFLPPWEYILPGVPAPSNLKSMETLEDYYI